MASKVITTRIDPDVQDAAESILKMLGMTRSQAINMFYRMIIIKRGLPFQPVMDETEYILSHPEWMKQLEASRKTHESGQGIPAPQEILDEINNI